MLDAVEVKDPIFIVGHWRTGTTHLHNLLCRDPDLAFTSVLQTIAPEASIAGERWLRPLFSRLLPATRPFDNVPLSLDAPQEEEFGMTAMSPLGFYHGYFFFPRAMDEYLRRVVLFEDGDPKVREEWKQTYLRLLRIATLRAGGRRLILKSPPNTGRLRVLREMFPEARFIHIHRDPRVVFSSTVHMRTTMLKLQSLHRWSVAEVEEQTLAVYVSLLQRYLEDAPDIPRGQLTEVAFADLEERPLDELRRLYAELDLPGWSKAEPHFRTALEGQGTYRKNAFSLPLETAARVEDRWAFAFERWGYSR